MCSEKLVCIINCQKHWWCNWRTILVRLICISFENVMHQFSRFLSCYSKVNYNMILDTKLQLEGLNPDHPFNTLSTGLWLQPWYKILLYSSIRYKTRAGGTFTATNFGQISLPSLVILIFSMPISQFQMTQSNSMVKECYWATSVPHNSIGTHWLRCQDHRKKCYCGKILSCAIYFFTKFGSILRLHSEDIPRRPMITHSIDQFILDPKSKQDKVKVTNLKNLPKLCDTLSEVAWEDV